MSRPKIDIDDEQVSKLAKIGATNVEIADFFGCSEATIRERFCDILTKARSENKIRLRQLQWREAENGNYKMMIWLGKQILKQTDNGPAEDLVDALGGISIAITDFRAKPRDES